MHPLSRCATLCSDIAATYIPHSCAPRDALRVNLVLHPLAPIERDTRYPGRGGSGEGKRREGGTKRGNKRSYRNAHNCPSTVLLLRPTTSWQCLRMEERGRGQMHDRFYQARAHSRTIRSSAASTKTTRTRTSARTTLGVGGWWL